MNKKAIIFGIGAVGVIVLLGFVLKGENFFKSSRQTQPADRPTSVGPVRATVNYADSGFSPETVRVKVGDAVVFVNGSAQPMWVASDPHPVHSAYAQFDARRGYDQGDSYSYTFEKVGTWGYHNHSVPTHTGKIVVEQ